ncbi:MAG: tRNA adenosine(34) deaminase TadA [Gracilibacteraceae bacterium]|nr:tRNA adenosine(34) deaminase TadA [Gracilibacteraceae bacterium]
METHRKWMAQALDLAKQAAQRNEVPVGAVIVVDDSLVAAAANSRETLKDPTAHAEILALRQAAQRLGTWRLTEATLYVTLEPCPMCAGAVAQSRVNRLVYGATDAKGGAVESVMNVLHPMLWNHKVDIIAGVMSDECRELLQEFFQARRTTSHFL